MDAVGTNIRLDVRQRQVMRILPRINDDVNEEWAHDKTRHHVDALVRNRLDRPWVREKRQAARGELGARRSRLFAEQAEGGGREASRRSPATCSTPRRCMRRRSCSQAQGSSLLEGRQTGLDYDVSSLAAVAFNSTIAGIENADAILLVGTNPRWEAPLVNTRCARRCSAGAKVFAIGPEVDLGYPVEWLGDDLALLGKLPKDVGRRVRDGAAAGGDRRRRGAGGGRARRRARRWPSTLKLVRDGWNGFNVLHTAAVADGRADARLRAEGRHRRHRRGQARGRAAARRRRGRPSARSPRRFKVYIGHHGDKGAAAADLVLPGAAYTEKHGTYVNIEGRVQRGERAVFPPGDAREDWTIFRALSELLGKPLPFDSFDQLRAAMVARHPAARPRRPDRPAVGAAEARRQGRRPGRLSDQGLLPDQRDLPRQPDHAALLGRAGPRP